MFTEELAHQIGIAYGVYCIQCEDKCETPIEIGPFIEKILSSIDEVRMYKGLVDENDVCG